MDLHQLNRNKTAILYPSFLPMIWKSSYDICAQCWILESGLMIIAIYVGRENGIHRKRIANVLFLYRILNLVLDAFVFESTARLMTCSYVGLAVVFYAVYLLINNSWSKEDKIRKA